MAEAEKKQFKVSDFKSSFLFKNNKKPNDKEGSSFFNFLKPKKENKD